MVCRLMYRTYFSSFYSRYVTNRYRLSRHWLIYNCLHLWKLICCECIADSGFVIICKQTNLYKYCLHCSNKYKCYSSNSHRLQDNRFKHSSSRQRKYNRCHKQPPFKLYNSRSVLWYFYVFPGKFILKKFHLTWGLEIHRNTENWS